MRKLYMHTMNGKPAEFHEETVVFAGWKVRRFATSLEQIRREQRMSRQWDIEKRTVGEYKYGYRLLYIPDAEEGKT